jgi:hypothetical protein
MSEALTILEGIASSGGLAEAKDAADLQEPYNRQWWQDTFVGTDDAPFDDRDEDVECILKRYPTHPTTLSRTDVAEIGRTDEPNRDRRLLIASLMWGYGTSGLWRRQTKEAVRRLFRDPFVGLYERLEKCGSLLADPDIGAAYTSLTGIPGVRSAFFTKYLYFKGRALDEDWDYPLILDTLVAKSLASLTGHTHFVTLDSYWPKEDPASYCRYVHTMHRWAEHLHTTADAIEFYLWRPGSSFTKLCAQVHAEHL